jgi:SAM-dependent methyltransferase
MNLMIAARRLIQNLRTVPYYRSLRFMAADLALGGCHLLSNPYRLTRQFREARGEEPYTYGETPIPVLAEIARRCQLTEQDICLELGCGSGRTALWLRGHLRATVWAVDQVPALIRRAVRVARFAGLQERLSFNLADFTQECPAVGASFAYLAGSCLDEATILQLTEQLAAMAPGSRLATVSFPLSDYRPDLFQVTDQFEGLFLWGKSTVYCQVRL